MGSDTGSHTMFGELHDLLRFPQHHHLHLWSFLRLLLFRRREFQITKRGCSGGFTITCPTILEMMPFSPPFPFHLPLSFFSRHLNVIGQLAALMYLKDESKSHSQFSLTINNWLCTAKWKSSLTEADALYSAYVSNAHETDWRVGHITQGGCKRQMLQSLFANCERQWNTW